MTLTLGLALVFTLRDLVFLKWPIEGFGFPARLALKGLAFALVTLLVIWIHRLQKQELERKGITDDNLFEPDGVTRDLQALALIARANSRNPSHALVRAFNRGSEVWLKRYAKALTRQFGFLGMRMRTRMNNQAFLLKEQFLDLHFGMIGSSGDGRRETAGFLSSFHEELSVGFGLRTQRDDSRVTFVDFLRMDMVARVVLLAALAVLVRKPEWRVPAMLYASGLFVLFGHTKSLEKIQESILEKVNFLK
ncbi:MAG: hypothetical protein Q8O00_14720 [Holophaga sp.]|nr:hypothetical protein [Holophaga sp.]